MKYRLLWATFGYVASVALLLSFLYWFLKNEGFDERTFVVGALFVLLLSVGWGYIIASHLIVPHQKTQEHLFHLTKDIIHELNIPLSTIQANTTMLLRKSDDERMQKRLGRIDEASLRLKRLYEELVYAIRKEMHLVEREVFDVAEVVKARVEHFKLLRRNPIEVSLESCQIKADKIGFEQAFDNLMSNAMKYSSKDSVVTVRLKEGVLEIEDRGIGMDEEALMRVFERYYRATNKAEGEGIGLALVKSYCDKEKIAIEIRSQKDIGTVVILRLDEVIHAPFTQPCYSEEKEGKSVNETGNSTS